MRCLLILHGNFRFLNFDINYFSEKFVCFRFITLQFIFDFTIYFDLDLHIIFQFFFSAENEKNLQVFLFCKRFSKVWILNWIEKVFCLYLEITLRITYRLEDEIAPFVVHQFLKRLIFV